MNSFVFSEGIFWKLSAREAFGNPGKSTKKTWSEESGAFTSCEESKTWKLHRKENKRMEELLRKETFMAEGLEEHFKE